MVPDLGHDNGDEHAMGRLIAVTLALSAATAAHAFDFSGHSEDEIRLIMGGNILRLLRATLPAS